MSDMFPVQALDSLACFDEAPRDATNFATNDRQSKDSVHCSQRTMPLMIILHLLFHSSDLRELIDIGASRRHAILHDGGSSSHLCPSRHPAEPISEVWRNI